MRNRVPLRRESFGFTIIEVMVVVVIMGIITTVVATMFAQGSTALQHGEAHNSLQRAQRLIAARVTPYISSAFDATDLMQGAPLLDPAGTTSGQYDPAPTDSTGATWLGTSGDPAMRSDLRFLTTEDFLDIPFYPAQTNSAQLALSLSDLNAFVYQVSLQDVKGDGIADDVVLLNLDPDNSFNIRNRGGAPVDPLPLFISRDSARIGNSDPNTPALRFYHPATHVVVMEVDLTSNADFSEVTRKIKPTQTFRTTFNLPSKGQ